MTGWLWLRDRVQRGKPRPEPWELVIVADDPMPLEGVAAAGRASGATVRYLTFRDDPWRLTKPPDCLVVRIRDATTAALLWLYSSRRYWPYPDTRFLFALDEPFRHPFPFDPLYTETEQLESGFWPAREVAWRCRYPHAADPVYAAERRRAGDSWCQTEASLRECAGLFAEVCRGPAAGERHAAWLSRTFAGPMVRCLARHDAAAARRWLGSDTLDRIARFDAALAERSAAAADCELVELRDDELSLRARGTLELAGLQVCPYSPYAHLPDTDEGGLPEPWLLPRGRRRALPVVCCCDAPADQAQPAGDAVRTWPDPRSRALWVHRSFALFSRRVGLTAGVPPFILVHGPHTPAVCPEFLAVRLDGRLGYAALLPAAELAALPDTVRRLAAAHPTRPFDLGEAYEALWQGPLTLDVLLDLGAVALQSEYAATAYSVFAEAAQRFPDSPEACLGVALALRVFYGPRHDLEWLERAAAVGPDHLESWRAYALALRRVGQDREALCAWRRVVELAPADAEAWLWMGEILSEQGDRSEAREAWRQAEQVGLALTPYSEAARWARRFLERG